MAGTITGRYVKFPDYVFNPLEESSEKERAENIRSYADVARSLIELGAKQADVFEWLKSFKDFHLDQITLDDMASDLDDYPDDAPDGGDLSSGLDTPLSNADWDENKHPRDKDGKFGSGGASSSDIMGPKYENIKGQAAIKKLLDVRAGHVPAAFNRADIGDIDLIWGNDNMGLQHIIKRRTETGQNLEKLLNNLTNTIERGTLSFNKSTGRLEIKQGDNAAIISPQLYGKNIKFVLTAFEIRKLNGDS